MFFTCSTKDTCMLVVSISVGQMLHEVGLLISLMLFLRFFFLFPLLKIYFRSVSSYKLSVIVPNYIFKAQYHRLKTCNILYRLQHPLNSDPCSGHVKYTPLLKNEQGKNVRHLTESNWEGPPSKNWQTCNRRHVDRINNNYIKNSLGSAKLVTCIVT